jgi:hypothetical protein
MHADLSIKRLLARPETLEAEVAALRRILRRYEANPDTNLFVLKRNA